MRKIKFRVFAIIGDDDCREGGYLETPDGIDFFYDGGYRSLGYFLKHPKAFVVEQFTGYSDINGLEVYEGDVLFVKEYNFEGDEFDSMVGVVDWVGAAFVINRADKFVGKRYLEDDSTKCQVLGNVNKQRIPNIKN